MMGISQPDVVYSEQTVVGQYEPVGTAVPLFIGYTATGSAYSLAEIGSFDDFKAVFGGPVAGGPILYYAVQHFFGNGGQGGFVLSLGVAPDASAQPAAFITALSDGRIATAVAQEQRITLLTCPDVTLIPDDEESTWGQAWVVLLVIAQARANVFAILDAPDDPASATACLSDFKKQNPSKPEWGAAYWPRLVLDDASGANQQIIVPPSAAVAAVMATVDEEYGPWRAPANVALSQVVKPTHSWLESSGLFNETGQSLNLVRSFPGNGVRIWGCRTLATDMSSPYLYVQIRRFVASIESRISQIGRHFIFENNDALTWIKFRGIVNIMLRELWIEGALYGSEEAEAYFVQIGLNETMTQDDIDQGRMVMKVGVAVAYPAEFIEISLTFDARASAVIPG